MIRKFFSLETFDKPIVAPSDFGEIAGFFVAKDTIRAARHLGGVPNVTFLVDTRYHKLAVRVCNNGYTSDEHLALELATLRYLEEKEYPWSPRLVSGLNGSPIQNWRGYRVIAMELLPGKPADEVDVSPDACFEIGGAISRLSRELPGLDFAVPLEESFWNRSERLLGVLCEDLTGDLWGLEPRLLSCQWKDASRAIRESFPEVGLIHTDVWPPNVLILDGRLSGIVDFDDMALGPAFLDIAAAISEFAIGPDLDLKVPRLQSMITGYRHEGGHFGDREVRGLVAGITVCYISWLACNALHGVPFVDSVVYVDRLAALRNEQVRQKLDESFRRCAG